MSEKTIFFDAYGTLLELGNYHRDLSALMLKETKFDLDLDSFHLAWNEEFDRAIFGIIEGNKPFATIRAIYGTSLKNAFLRHSVHLKDEQVNELNIICREFLDQRCSILPSASKIIGKLKEDGANVGLVSNGDDEEVLYHLGDLVELFDSVITSENVGLYKPDPQIFKVALDALGADASKSLHVGDNLRIDVEGSNRAGVGSIWYNRRNKHLLDGIQPMFTISDMEEVLEIFNLMFPKHR
ncbi:MAG: HAD family hydrolase [Methanocellales archaeon]|nr:HAD family hydrolase [Methanocellales archaeon]